jgi:hydrogenase-4 component B
MSSAVVLGLGAGTVLLGGLASLALVRVPRLADLCTGGLIVLGLLVCAGSGAAVLLGAPPITASIQPAVPGGSWAIFVDPLAAWFLVVLGTAGAGATAYGVRYLAAERAHRPVAIAHAVFSLVLAAMVGVVVAHAAVLFLLAWEIMALSAYFLIMFEGERREVRRAGLIYLVLTHTGTLLLIAMFLIWGRGSADLTFQSLATAAPAVPWGGGLVLLLALAGFGVKAGLVPLHFWLPGAHASAPSHVSALLSGVMLKMGIYGLLRVISLLGAPPAWFGWTLFTLGLVSAVLGVLWALGQHDLKRALAYSSVENIGIILLAMGVGVLGLATGRPVVAVLGFTAAVLHTLNHSLFKSLLFLAAGAVVGATGTRAIDRLGGLGRRMPLTAAAFFGGSIAIVGLPPLNGFISEWVAALGLLRGAQTPGPLSLIALGIAGLGLIGALALACFTRVSGAVFLGHPRGRAFAARDDWGLVAPMMGLLTLCLLVGVYPGIAVRPAVAVARSIMMESGGEAADAVSILSSALPAIGAVAALLAGLTAIAGYFRLRAGRVNRAAVNLTWGCAYALPGARMQYTASSFSAPVLSAFGSFAERGVERDATSFATDPEDRVLTRLVRPLWARARALAEALRPLQQGRVTTYLQYMVLTVLFLLGALFVAIGRRP